MNADGPLYRSGASGTDDVVSFDWTRTESVAAAVVDAVAAGTSADPMEMEPLHSAIDPDALNALFDRRPDRPGQPALSIEFAYSGATIRVNASGTGTVVSPL